MNTDDDSDVTLSAVIWSKSSIEYEFMSNACSVDISVLSYITVSSEIMS